MLARAALCLTSSRCHPEPPRLSGTAATLTAGEHLRPVYLAPAEANSVIAWPANEQVRRTALAPGRSTAPRTPRAAAATPFGFSQLGQPERLWRSTAGGGLRRCRRAVALRMVGGGSDTPRNASAFAWGGAEGDEALRLPSGVAAAERLAARRPPGRPARPAQPPAEVEEARKDPVAILAVLLIISWQLIGSLIGEQRALLAQLCLRTYAWT